MAPFRVGSLTPKQLRFHATGHDEYLIDEVINHEIRGDQLWLKVKWTGYPLSPDDPESWVSYKDCRFAPQVKSYVKDHHLL